MTARRILVCLHDFARGGTERIAINLARDWAAAGRDVTILCGSQEGGLRDMVDARVRVVALDPPIRRGFLSRWRLGRAMRARLADLKPGILFLPGNFHLFLASGLRPAGVPMVMKVSNPPLPQGWMALPGRLVFRHFARAVDGFGALTTDLARQVAVLAPGKPVPVLHDPIYLSPHDAAAAMPQGVCNILWAGRLEPQKDIALALHTLAAFPKPAHLTILGDGGQAGLADDLIARLRLKERVTRVGAVAAIDPWLARADVLLLTSRYEGQPAVVGEALARGVPVVATDCSSMVREVIATPAAGRVVASRDPAGLARALAQVCAAPRPPRAGLAALVADFTPQRCARAWLDWFDAMAAHDA